MSVEGRGVGIERPDGLLKDDDEFDAYRKRMMLAYRFRPNPLVSIFDIVGIIIPQMFKKYESKTRDILPN